MIVNEIGVRLGPFGGGGYYAIVCVGGSNIVSHRHNLSLLRFGKACQISVKYCSVYQKGDASCCIFYDPQQIYALLHAQSSRNYYYQKHTTGQGEKILSELGKNDFKKDAILSYLMWKI